MRPLVSVVLPNYNYGSFLKESVEAILNQSCNDFELLITDDFSTDNSRDIIETLRRKDKRIFFIYNNTNLGASYSRNKAMEKSAGKYIAFCDADDIWNKDKLKIQIENLETKREYDVTFCDSMIIDQQGTETGVTFGSMYGKVEYSEGSLFEQLCESNFINNSTVLLRRSCLEKVGLLDERLRYLQDWLYWICLARHFKFLFIDKILAKYRRHSRSSDHDRVGYCKERIMVRKTIMERFLDLPNTMKSSLYYRTANDYAYLKEKRIAYANYVMSLRYNKTNPKSFLRILSLPFKPSY